MTFEYTLLITKSKIIAKVKLLAIMLQPTTIADIKQKALVLQLANFLLPKNVFVKYKQFILQNWQPSNFCMPSDKL